MNVKPKVSVIVASHRPDFVGGLAAIVSTYVKATIPTEIIIVADYQPDTFRKDYPLIQWVYMNNTSISAKRNRGIATSKGSIIAFIDDDCRPSKEWLHKGIEYLEKNADSAGVEGLTRIASPAEERSSFNIDYKRLETPGYRTNNIFYRADIIKHVNGFDERFTVQREDVDLAFTILKQGHRIDFSQEIQVSHMIRTDEPWDILKNCWNRRFDPLLFKKHPALYRKNLNTPWSGSIAANGIITLITVLMALFPRPEKTKRRISSTLFAPVISSSLFAHRRKGFGRVSLDFALESLFFLFAPLVLFTALAYGSIRYRAYFLY